MKNQINYRLLVFSIAIFIGLLFNGCSNKKENKSEVFSAQGNMTNPDFTVCHKSSKPSGKMYATKISDLKAPGWGIQLTLICLQGLVNRESPSLFIVQKPAAGVTELRLTGGDFKSCGTRALQSAGKATKPVRRLWAKGKGKFRTRGRYSSAAIRGTWWLTADFCDNTLTSVKQGVVTVRDLVKKKTVVVKEGSSYAAKR